MIEKLKSEAPAKTRRENWGHTSFPGFRPGLPFRRMRMKWDGKIRFAPSPAW
jgi:hypothetical protein